MIKKFPLLLIIFAFSMNSYAKCHMSYMEFWPPRGKFASNGVLLVNLFGTATKFAHRFNSLNKAYLYEFNTKNKIRLIAKEVFDGYQIKQVLLKPEKELNPGTIYYLKINSLSRKDKEELWFDEEYDAGGNDVLFTYNDEAVWMAIGRDTISPSFEANPEFIDNRYKRLGCGPSFYSNFKPNCKDNSLITYRITLTRTDSLSKPLTAFVSYFKDTIPKYEDFEDIAVGQNSWIFENYLPIGYGMCGGPFKIELGKTYKAVLTAMDASGNYCPDKKEVTFTASKPSN